MHHVLLVAYFIDEQNSLPQPRCCSSRRPSCKQQNQKHNQLQQLLIALPGCTCFERLSTGVTQGWAGSHTPHRTPPRQGVLNNAKRQLPASSSCQTAFDKLDTRRSSSNTSHRAASPGLTWHRIGWSRRNFHTTQARQTPAVQQQCTSPATEQRLPAMQGATSTGLLGEQRQLQRLQRAAPGSSGCSSSRASSRSCCTHTSCTFT